MKRSRLPSNGPVRFAIGVLVVGCIGLSQVRADESLEAERSWSPLNSDQMSIVLRDSLTEYGVGSTLIESAAERFESGIGQQSSDAMDAFVAAVSSATEAVGKLSDLAGSDPVAAAASIDPAAEQYAELEALPKPIRMTVRTWLARTLVRERFFDEALPVIAEVDPTHAIDPAAALFYRGTCYHTLLMKKEALADLRSLLENEAECPVRFSRIAKLMVADIKPLKEDSLDEISRLMSDVSRRLDLGRSGDQVEQQEQKIIDKLTKMIDKLEQQQQQQQQQQQSGGGGGGGNSDGKSAPMQDSQIAGGSGNGNVQKKDQKMKDGWGNLPPAERKEALQKISRDLPTHYRDAIEAYFRKRATDG